MRKSAILCVDDEPLVLRSIKRELDYAFGDEYVYESAENADEALELIRELYQEGFVIVAIVSDWLMPGMKGDEFLIQVHQQFPDIVMILLTGHATEEAVNRAVSQQALHYYLSKPWDGKELIDCIETGLAKVKALAK